MSARTPARAESDGDADYRSLRLSDARIGIYLLFAAEISFFAAVLGAYIVLRYSAATSFAGQAKMQLLWVVETSLTVHVLGGMLAQQLPRLMRQTPKRGNARLFWALTAAMLVLVSTILVIAR